MTAQEELNKNTVLRFNSEVLENGSIDAINEIISPEFINYSSPPGIPHGPQGMIDFINVMHKSLTGKR